jgi:hypothetical protein
MKMKKSNEKMWALMVYLSANQWSTKTYLKDTFDDSFWEYILKESEKCGINTILLDVGDGVEFGTHPEIADENAWTRRRVRKEVARCRDLGIKIIPKLNFATTHSYWMGEYRKMTSSIKYYQFANDIIKETYELFDHPDYIHIGMDEEGAKFCGGAPYCVYRQKDLFWHDLRFLYDCVADTSAMPMLWFNPLHDDPEGYKKHFDPDEAVLQPYYYNAFRKEHWTPVESRAEYVAYYNEDRYKDLGIKFVEQDPYLVKFREQTIPLMEEGYLYLPCASVYNRCDWNHSDLVEYFRDNAPDEQILGYMSAPWARTTWDRKERYDETFKFFKEAKEKFYK